MTSSWTPDLVSALTAAWESGASVSAIARQLGVTKNAVMGKVHRLRLTPRPSPLPRPARRHGGRPHYDFCGTHGIYEGAACGMCETEMTR